MIESYLNSDLKNQILKIVGTGPELTKLKNKYNNENIEFLEQLPNKETIDLILGSKELSQQQNFMRVNLHYFVKPL